MIEVEYLEDMPLCVSPENPFETETPKFELRTDKKMLIDPSKVMFASTFLGLVREHSDEDSPKNEFKEVEILELVYGENLYVRTIYRDGLKGILVKPYSHPELVEYRTVTKVDWDKFDTDYANVNETPNTKYYTTNPYVNEYSMDSVGENKCRKNAKKTK